MPFIIVCDDMPDISRTRAGQLERLLTPIMAGKVYIIKLREEVREDTYRAAAFATWQTLRADHPPDIILLLTDIDMGREIDCY